MLTTYFAVRYMLQWKRVLDHTLAIVQTLIKKQNRDMTNSPRLNEDPGLYLQTLCQEPSMKGVLLGEYIKMADLPKLLR